MARQESEQLFEQYLTANGYADWLFEPKIPGKKKHPDYLLRWKGQEFLLEVKELREKEPPPIGKGLVPAKDPCKGLREEINEARKKFREFKEGWCCSLVVCNVADWQAELGPLWVFSAMLGDLGFTWSVDKDGNSVPDQGGLTFLGRGKMIRGKTGSPQNTTISSIIVLQRYKLPDLDFERAFGRETSRLEAQNRRSLTAQELAEVACRVHQSFPQKTSEVPRIVVVDNPFAGNPLPRDLFTGSYDERWALVDDCVQRVFVGNMLRQGEEAE